MSCLFKLEKPLKLERTTIHVAANLIDSYLWHRQMVPAALKPLAFASLRIAAMEVEGISLSLDDLEVFYSKMRVQLWHITEMEALIFDLLQERLRPPTVQCFVEIFAIAWRFNEHPTIYNYAVFLADLAVLNHATSTLLPSTLAVGCLKFALR